MNDVVCACLSESTSACQLVSRHPPEGGAAGDVVQELREPAKAEDEPAVSLGNFTRRTFNLKFVRIFVNFLNISKISQFSANLRKTYALLSSRDPNLRKSPQFSAKLARKTQKNDSKNPRAKFPTQSQRLASR